MKKEKTEFVYKSVKDLIPYARNARTHSDDQIDQIANSIKEFGFINPIIVSNDNGIIAGHGRVLAALKLGIENVPCIVESHLTETQKRAYILADNKLALNAGWDDELLRIELDDLKNIDFDLSLTGFDLEEIDVFLNENNYCDEQIPTNLERQYNTQEFFVVSVKFTDAKKLDAFISTYKQKIENDFDGTISVRGESK